MTTKKGSTTRPQTYGDLSELLAAVLNHPELPERLYEKITDALVEMWDNTEIYNDPRALAALLAYHQRKRAAKKGGA